MTTPHRQPPVVFYPRPSKPTKPTTRPQRPSNPAAGNTGYHRPLRPSKPIYGQLPQRPATPTIVNRPTVINNQTTNIINNTTNINNWFQKNSWQNRVTINSNHWNGRPWWHKPDYGDWHHGHWHGHYYFKGRDAWRHIDSDQHPWLNGLAAWGLGNLMYRSGYRVYANPYRLKPVVIGTTTIDYSRPICVQLSAYERAYANDEARAEQLRTRALAYFAVARQRYLLGDYQRAYDNVNLALALLPDDTSLHEFRALVLFAVGRYQEAAEVMHAVLAVAPGWDWTTLSALYRDNSIYTRQLRALEQYIRVNPRRSDARFLLAYHYITTGYPENAEAQLRSVLTINPNDRLSADLLTLLTEEAESGVTLPEIGRVPTQRELEGDWKARRPEGTIELDLEDDQFEWDYDLENNDQRFRGKYTIRQNLLIFATENGSQMVGTLHMRDRNRFTFRLLGSSANDPGLEFVRR